MGWHLAEVFSDTGAVPGILAYLNEHPRSTVPASAGQPSTFQQALKTFGINLSLVDNDNVPPVYGGDVHAWLADDVLELLTKLGLVLQQEGAVTLTALGNAVLREQVSAIDALAAGLYHWTEQTEMDSLPYRPVVSLLDLLKQLYDARPAPCPGLMLPEAVQVLKMFYQGEDVSGCLSRLLTWREEAIASIPDEAKAAIDDEEITQRVRVCLFLADDVEPIDLCRAQTTLIHVIGGALAAYGGLYERVQYITFHNSLQSRVTECRLYPGDSLALAQTLTWAGQ